MRDGAAVAPRHRWESDAALALVEMYDGFQDLAHEATDGMRWLPDPVVERVYGIGVPPRFIALSPIEIVL